MGAIFKVLELRLRFIVLLTATGLVFASWDTLINHFEKWSRPRQEQNQIVTFAAGAESFCPMHPNVVRPEPGQCPICGMPLARRKRTGFEVLPSGVLSRVRLTPWQIAQGGIRTVAVNLGPSISRLATVGRVGFDDSRRVLVTSEARGRARIERLHVHSEGEHVRAGQRLAELYSYDVAQSIQVLLEASRALHSSSATVSDPEATPLEDPKERFQLASQALKVLGVRQDQLAAITQDDRSNGLLPLIAPIAGLVIKKNAYQGQYVPEGTLLFEIADLEHVWVNAQVFEDDLAIVRVGQPVVATVPAFPGEEFRGQVELLAPALDPTTQTLTVRFSLDNPGNRLRPGMLATVTLNVDRRGTGMTQATRCPVTHLRLGAMGLPISVEIQGRNVSVCCKACVSKLKADPEKFLHPGLGDTAAADHVVSVCESAVVDTGTKKIVYVEINPGVFEGRVVVLGPRSGDFYPVLDGLDPGDRVATSGAFLIDAESRLNPPPG